MSSENEVRFFLFLYFLLVSDIIDLSFIYYWSKMSLDKLKSELSRADKGKLDKITAKEKQEILESLTDVFAHLSKAQKAKHIKEFLDLKQHLEGAFALEQKFSSTKTLGIQKQLRLANDYQKMIEDSLGVPLSHFLAKQKKKKKKKKPDIGHRLSQEQALKQFDAKEIWGRTLILAEWDDFVDDLQYLKRLSNTTDRIKRNDPNLKSPIIKYLLSFAQNPKAVFTIPQNIPNFENLSGQKIAMDTNLWEIVTYKESGLISKQASKDQDLPIVSQKIKKSDLEPVFSQDTGNIQDAEYEEITDKSWDIASDGQNEWLQDAEMLSHFDDADYGVAFAKYCVQNGITRADGKQIPWRWGLLPGVQYKDKEWNLLLLAPMHWWAQQHDDLGAVTEYQLYKLPNKKSPYLLPPHSDEYVDYEEITDDKPTQQVSKDEKTSDQEPNLDVEEKKQSLITSAPVVVANDSQKEEEKDKNQTSEPEKPLDQDSENQNPEENQDQKSDLLPAVVAKPQDSETPVQESQNPVPILIPENPRHEESPVEEPKKEEIQTSEPDFSTDEYAFNLSAVLSDTQNIHQEQARLIAEEELKTKYSEISKRNLFKKGAYFLQRGRKRKKIINEFMKNASQNAFGDDVENAASRHAQELQNGLQTLDQKAELVSIPELNLLSRGFIEGSIDEATFQTQFNSILTTNPQIKSAIEQMKYKGTDILHNLKLEKEQYQLVNELAQNLDQGGNADQVTQKIEDFIAKYQKNPDFLQAIASDLDKKDLNKLKKYFHHQKAVRKLALENLQIKLKVLTGGKSAYQIDNSANEKSRVHKLGKKLDKIPLYLQVPGYAGAGVLLGLAGGPLGLGVVGTSILTTSTFAATSGFTNFIKKRTHYTKEHNTHEKNLTQDFDAEQEKIAQWQADLEKKWAKNWRTRYKAKRQLDLYNNSTQKDIIKTEDFTKDLLWFSTTLRPLNQGDQDKLKLLLMQGKARLDAYYETGHNFLASSSKEQIESDMLKLHKVLQLGAEKLGLDYDAINEQSIVLKSDSDQDQNLSYQDIKQQLLTDYSTANKHFKSQRRRLASKYGVGSAALSAGTAIGMQYMMGTGMFSTESVSHTVSSTSHASSNANFNLGSHQLAEGNQIHSSVADHLSGLGDKANVVAHYWAGTDATLVRAGSQALWESAYHAKVNAIADQIKHLALSSDQKAAFLKELTNRPWELDRSKAFTNDYLQGDRCAEGLLQMAKGLADSGNQSLIPELAYDAGKSIAGTTLHSMGERFFNVGLAITTQTVQNQPWSGSTRFVPIVSFFNTFKKTPKSGEKQAPNSDSSSPDVQKEQQKEQKSDLGSQAPSDLGENRASDSEKLDTGASTAQKVAAWAALAGAAAVAVETQRNPSKARQYRENLKLWAKNLWTKLKASRNKAAKKVKEKSPQRKENAKNGREKTKELAHKGAQKTKEARNSASEKVKEKSPEWKEKAKEWREKTKEVAKKWAEKTKEKVQSLKNKLFDKEKNEGKESDLEDFEAMKKSSATQSFLETKGYIKGVDENWYSSMIESEVFKPNQKIDYHGKTLFLTDKINDHYVIAYVEQNGVLEPRVFRRSSSGGNWHAVPGYDGSRVSKGEFVENISYEKGTVVHKDFNEILDNILDQNKTVPAVADVMKKVYGTDIPEIANREIGQHYDELPKSAQEFYDETKVFDELLTSFPNRNATWNNAFKSYQNLDQIKSYYDQIDLSQNMDFSSSQILGNYSSEHKHLWSVDNQVMTAKIKSSNPEFDGREIQVTIATAQKDGLSWVENIVFSDDPGTSFFTQKTPISWGLLMTKPIEYFSQVPQFVRDEPSLEEFDNKYVDVRPLMQNNPLIKERKKLQS